MLGRYPFGHWSPSHSPGCLSPRIGWQKKARPSGRRMPRYTTTMLRPLGGYASSRRWRLHGAWSTLGDRQGDASVAIVLFDRAVCLVDDDRFEALLVEGRALVPRAFGAAARISQLPLLEAGVGRSLA